MSRSGHSEEDQRRSCIGSRSLMRRCPRLYKDGSLWRSSGYRATAAPWCKPARTSTMTASARRRPLGACSSAG
eukprot:1467008-Pyramimonas_sp.AAC.1